MSKNLPKTRYGLIVALLVLGAAVLPLLGSEHHGTVKFGGLPLPGATVIEAHERKRGDKSFSAITDLDGRYSFPDLPDGVWTIQVEMPLFSPVQQEVTVGAGAAAADWDLKLLPAQEISAIVTPAPPGCRSRRLRLRQAAPAKPARKGKDAPPAPTNTATAFQRTDLNAAPSNNEDSPSASDAAPQETTALSQRAADGLLINGSVNNGASSPFAQLQAFGNNRRGVRSLYNGNLGFSLRNSALDARSFSQTGQDTLKPGYNQMQGLASFGGPLKIPGLLNRNGPNFVVNYQWVHNRNASTQPGLMPTSAQRNGDFSSSPVPVLDPDTHLPFPGNTIPLVADQPAGSGVIELVSAAQLRRQHALQLPDPVDLRPAPGQPAGAHEQAGQEESVSRVRWGCKILAPTIPTCSGFWITAGRWA